MSSSEESTATATSPPLAQRHPKINPIILLSAVAEGYVAYDPKQDRLHQLNPVAALLTELCDGHRSIDDIRALAGPLIPAGQATEVERWIEGAVKAGLLVWEGSELAQGRELSADELHDLARRLTTLGNVQTAFLCGKRAVELKPDNWDAWYVLGEIAQCVGRRDEARSAYQKYFDAHPEDAEIEHLLVALRDDMPPPRMSDRAVQHIYKGFAPSYESRMREDLKYVGPERVDDAITSIIGDRGGLSVLDLGCGSGLTGSVIKKRAAHLIGIDLSPEMIALARARNIYDRLDVAEITEWLDQGETPFDLVISCDCIIYFGDLTRFVTAAGKRLAKDGLLAISMERGRHYPFNLTDTGRYAHHPDHLRDVARDTGLRLLCLNESFLRMEYGEEVIGLFAVFGLPETSRDAS